MVEEWLGNIKVFIHWQWHSAVSSNDTETQITENLYVTQELTEWPVPIKLPNDVDGDDKGRIHEVQHSQVQHQPVVGVFAQWATAQDDVDGEAVA